MRRADFDDTVVSVLSLSDLSGLTSRDMLTIWCNMQFAGRALDMLNEGTRGHRLVFSEVQSRSSLAAAGRDAALATADVALGQPDAEMVMESARLRWVHLTS